MKKHLFHRMVIFIGSAALLTGCASIVSKSVYPVTISSMPDKASLVITDDRDHEVYRGQTPATVHLKSSAGYFKSAKYKIAFSAPGFSDKVIPLHATINGWYMGNILLGGLIGMLIVDPATGAMWQIDSGHIHESLDEALALSELKIVDIKDVPEQLKSKMEKIP